MVLLQSNHLHLHGYYLNHQLRIETFPAEPILPKKTCIAFWTSREAFCSTPRVHTWIWQSTPFVVSLIFWLIGNIAHNLFITRGCPPRREHDPSVSRNGVRVIAWPRLSCFGAKEESAFQCCPVWARRTSSFQKQRRLWDSHWGRSPRNHPEISAAPRRVQCIAKACHEMFINNTYEHKSKYPVSKQGFQNT